MSAGSKQEAAAFLAAKERLAAEARERRTAREEKDREQAKKEAAAARAAEHQKALQAQAAAAAAAARAEADAEALVQRAVAAKAPCVKSATPSCCNCLIVEQVHQGLSSHLEGCRQKSQCHQSP